MRDDNAPLAPGLYVVSTPIGNLEDITLRALRVLKSVARIACEDTRQTRKLLDRYGIETPLVSYHQHNEQSRAAELVGELNAGAALAVVSDAGTPGVRDPGAELVAAAVAAGAAVFPVPGASALLAALVASGLPMDEFRFAGFLPSRSGERRTFLEQFASETQTIVVYETPHRITEALADIAEILGGSRRLVLARELTKLHEEFLRGTAAEIRDAIAARENVRGEIVLLIAGKSAEDTVAVPVALRDAMQALLASGLDEKDALKKLAKERNAGRAELYREWQRVKPR